MTTNKNLWTKMSEVNKQTKKKQENILMLWKIDIKYIYT